MKWLMRGAFVLMFIVALGWKLAKPPHGAGATALTDLAQAMDGRLDGPVTSRPSAEGTTARLIYTVPARGCDRPLLVIPADPSTTAIAFLGQFRRPGDHALFAYLDWVSANPDRWTLLRLRLRIRLEAMLGHGATSSPNVMLFIAEPAGCDVARTLPWARFWRRG